jgi:hypothetical protein
MRVIFPCSPGTVDHAGPADDETSVGSPLEPVVEHELCRQLRHAVGGLGVERRALILRVVGRAVRGRARHEEDVLAADLIGVASDVLRTGHIRVVVLAELVTGLTMDGCEEEDPIGRLDAVELLGEIVAGRRRTRRLVSRGADPPRQAL